MTKKKKMIPEEEYNQAPAPPQPEGEFGLQRVEDKAALTGSAQMGNQLPDATGNTLENIQGQELKALRQNNQAKYGSADAILADYNQRMEALKKQDANAEKRNNAYRYIAGLGDTLSSLANLVGTAHGAQNQKQVYNGSALAEKAEAARNERKLEMDELDKRISEMRQRQREMQAAGTLAEAQLKAKQERERIAEKNRIDKEKRELKMHEDNMTLSREKLAAGLEEEKIRADIREKELEERARNNATRSGIAQQNADTAAKRAENAANKSDKKKKPNPMA